MTQAQSNIRSPAGHSVGESRCFSGNQQQLRGNGHSGMLNPSARRKDVLRFFASSTTAHGFRKLNQPTRGLQLSWLCLITCAFCGLTVHLSTLVIKYYDEPITTKVDPKGSDFVYPDVTVCNEMMFGISNIFKQEPQVGNATSGGFSYHLSPEFQPLYDDIQHVRDVLNRTVRQYLLEKFSTYELDIDLLRVKDDTVYNLPNLVIRDTYGIARVSQFAAQASQMLLRCSYGSLACDFRDFTPLALPAYASCLSFSLDKFRRRRPGTEVSGLNELKLVLFVDATSLEPAVNAALTGLPGDTFNMQTNGGAMVFIHQPGTYPSNGQAVEASCGQETVVDVRYQEYLAKNRRKEPCLTETDIAGTTELYMVIRDGQPALGGFNSQPLDCRIRVAQQVLLETCGFVDPSLPISDEFFYKPRRANLSRLMDGIVSSDPGSVINEVIAAFAAVWDNSSATGNSSVYHQLPTVLDRLLDNETCLRRARILAGNDSRLSNCLDRCISRAYTTGFMSNTWPVANADFLRPLVQRWLQSSAFYLNSSSSLNGGGGINSEFVRRTSWNLYSAYSSIGSGTALQNLLSLRIRVGDAQGRGLRTEESWAYEIYDLLSDIGGILGLYLGMSLLTLCEMAELLLQLAAFTRLVRFQPSQGRAAGSSIGPSSFNAGLDLEFDFELGAGSATASTESQIPKQSFPVQDQEQQQQQQRGQ